MPAQRLRVYRFPAGASFTGEVIGALEQAHLGVDGGLLDALFIGRADDGEVQAIDLAIGLADGTVATLLDFRLDSTRRRATTERTLAEHAGAVPTAVMETVAGDLDDGEAVLAALVRGDRTPELLDDAVSRAGGRGVADEASGAATLADAAPRLLAVSRRS